MGPEKDGSAEARDQAADLRDEAAEGRDRDASVRDEAATKRDVAAREREQASLKNRRSEAGRLGERRRRDERAAAEEDRRRAAADREATHEFLTRLREHEAAILADRRAAAEDRRAAAEDRRAAARDRELAAWARQQAAVEAAQLTSEDVGRPAPAPPPAGSGQTESVVAEILAAGSAGTESQIAALESARHAADLADEVAQTEDRIATILRSLASTGEPSARRRRLDLAELAVGGMHAATERGERLRTLAERTSDDLMVSTLHTLVTHASTTCAALAETEGSIAAVLESMAAHESEGTAAASRRQATRARAAAQDAASRAQELSLLARGPDRSGEPDEPDEDPGP